MNTITVNNEFETIPAFTHVAGDTAGTWSQRQIAVEMAKTLETVSSDSYICHQTFIDIASSDDDDQFLMDVQQNLADMLTEHAPIPDYTNIALQDGEWFVKPYLDDELQRFDDCPDEFSDDTILIVNDHGNVTCMQWSESEKEYQSIWAMV